MTRNRWITFLLLPLCLFLLTAPTHAENLIANGDFVKGAEGWLWEQWENKPLPGKVVRDDGTNGAFHLGSITQTGARYFAKEVTLGSDANLLLKFSLKLEDVPPNAARVRVMVPNVGFVKGGDLLVAGGTKGWTPYSFPITTADLNGQRKIVIFFYHDHVESGIIGISDVELTEDATAGSSGTTTGVAAVSDSTPQSDQLVLTGDTSKPVLSTFQTGEPVELIFTVTGPNAKMASLQLVLDIVDEHGKKIDSKEIPIETDGSGRWVKKIPAPSAKLGFYRVYAKLSNGVKLRALGSRAEGFITYAIVPDPSKRKLYNEDETTFGMQGGFGPWVQEVLSYLGARWVLDSSLEWRKNEPDRAGQFRASDLKPAPEPKESVTWTTYTLPTLFAVPTWASTPESFAYMTGALTPEGEKAWAAYCKQAALAYMARNPNRISNLYQITWEPITPWGYKGTSVQLAKIFEIAHRVLHEVDPKAKVGGFTMGIVPEDIEQTTGVLKAGAGPYLDVITTHPYFSIEGERDGMIAAIRATKESVRKYAGREIPFVGTEQGYSTQEDPDKDIIHARGLLRQNLITLGEGFKFNFAYYIVDYRLGEQKGYGYYYNLVDGVPWGPAKAGPRPAAPAFAAQSLLLDGHKSAGAIEWLGGDSWGYAFEQPGDIVLALWDFGAKPKTVTIPVGARQVRVYDWMGNERTEPAKQGNVSLTLGPEPIYVRDVASTLWGSNAGKVLQVASKSMQAYPGDKIKVAGTISYDQEPALTGQLMLEADARLGWGIATQTVSAKKGTPLPYSFDLSVSPTLKPGSYALKISLNNDLGAYAVNGVNLQVQSPVALTHIQQLEEINSVKGLGFSLKEMQGKGATGKVQVELSGIAGSSQTKEFKTPAGVDTPVEFRYPNLPLDNARRYQATIKVTLDTGYTFQQTTQVNFLTARRFAKKPTLNGDTTLWQSAPAAALGKPQLIRGASYYRGEKDLGADLRCKWDSEALYVEVEVTDDVFRQDFDGTNTWKGDAIQLSINMDPHKEEMSTGNLLADDANRQRWSELAIAQTKNGPEGFRHLSFDPAQYPLGPVPASEMPIAVKRDESRKVTLYEITIPWKILGQLTPPKAGTTLAIAAGVNDLDDADQKEPSGLGLFGGIYPNKNVKKLGLLLLGEQP